MPRLVTITRDMTDPASENTRDGYAGESAEAMAQDALDQQLVAQAQSGDQRAVTRILERYQDRVFGVCLRMLGSSQAARQTAADLSQDALVKVIQGLHGFDRRSKFSTWAIRVTMNVCLTHRRSQKLRQTVSLDQPTVSGGPIRANTQPNRGFLGGETGSVRQGMESGASGELSGASRVEHEERRALVAQALEALEEGDRALVILRDVQGLEYGQIGEILSVPLGTVKSRLFRARLALRERIKSLQGPGVGDEDQGK